MSEMINTSATMQSVSRVQIPTNPKPKPGFFPESLGGYVERAFARCRGEAQMAASQAVMKEIITNAAADGTLHTRDWDAEPLPLPDVNNLSKESQTPRSFRLFKGSPTTRTESQGEPLAEEEKAGESMPENTNAIRYGGWKQATARDQKALVDSSEDKEDMVQDDEKAPAAEGGSGVQGDIVVVAGAPALCPYCDRIRRWSGVREDIVIEEEVVGGGFGALEPGAAVPTDRADSVIAGTVAGGPALAATTLTLALASNLHLACAMIQAGFHVLDSEVSFDHEQNFRTGEKRLH
ncbi:hypothetical protein MLD38_039716 [Melastoma candidum]|uniref:Uncharacterized protein n=1 Tax=Melastoma candidum TaxID=119954 RepID=A0ACB9L315_9MYRT|nr:hypothetical protein MLD38_039716 [Melastoma candidum]